MESLRPVLWTWAKRRFDREIGQVIGKSLIGANHKVWTRTLEQELDHLKSKRIEILEKKFSHLDERAIRVLKDKFIV